MRLLFVFVNFAVALVYAYIYVKAVIYQYCFWAVMLSGLAFLFLLIGTGKQVVYQQLVADDKIRRVEQAGRAIQWQFGVFLYSMAFPFCISANVLFWSKYSWLRGISKDRFWESLIPKHNADYRTDIADGLTVNYYREKSDDDWRKLFMIYAHLVPIACLSVDMLLNKIRMRPHHVIHQILLTVLYLATTFILHDSKKAVYLDNLNWRCSANWYFQYDKYPTTGGIEYYESSQVIDKVMSGTCRSPQENFQIDLVLDCQMLGRVYCPQVLDENDKNTVTEDDIKYFKEQGMVEWSPWDNAGFLAFVMILLGAISFLICCGIHRLKLGKSEPYTYDKELIKKLNE